MKLFPTFAELEEKRDAVNAHFHKEVEPQLIERVQKFGFVPVQSENPKSMVLKEKSTENEYRLTFRPYEIRVEFCHVRTQEKVLICEISNFSLSAHNIMEILIASIDSWLQYGIVYDYKNAQQFEKFIAKEA